MYIALYKMAVHFTHSLFTNMQHVSMVFNITVVDCTEYFMIFPVEIPNLNIFLSNMEEQSETFQSISFSHTLLSDFFSSRLHGGGSVRDERDTGLM